MPVEVCFELGEAAEGVGVDEVREGEEVGVEALEVSVLVQRRWAGWREGVWVRGMRSGRRVKALGENACHERDGLLVQTACLSRV